MIAAIEYVSSRQREWDAFIDGSKNGTFILKRGYMEYHADRFADASVVFEDGRGEIVAVLPASFHGAEVRSHGGITYGGIIGDRRMTAARMLECFNSMQSYYRSHGIKTILYKRVPSIFHKYPADEDLYALFRNGATLCDSKISCAIDLSGPIDFSDARRRCVKKAARSGITVKQSCDYEEYMEMVSAVLLAHHGAKPVHTGAEIRLLASRFPGNIKLFCAYLGDKMIAGVLVYDANSVVHTQYIVNSEEGREIGALDAVMDYLIHSYCAGKRYFDMGTSNGKSGHQLNEGLIAQKEMFGGRAIVYEAYRLDI